MMQNKPDAVLFDLDGTLLDTAPDFHWVINTLLATHNREPIDYHALRKHVSEGSIAMIKAAFHRPEDCEMHAELQQQMLTLYAEHSGTDSQLFPGINTLLDSLEDANIPWGIVTNKPERFTLPTLATFKLLDRSQSTICPEHVQHTKPHPESLLLACRQLRAAPENSIYIGDHVRDIEAGKRANMFTIAALYGYIKETEQPKNWKADYYVEDVDGILPCLNTQFYATRAIRT
jgi:phosphoglycolate phosphatase